MSDMLLTEEQKVEWVNRIIEKAKDILSQVGFEQRDAETGFVHLEARLKPFIIIEHQRQQIKSGLIKTNGIDVWELQGQNAKKVLSVNYMPFEIHFFEKAGKAPWIEAFLTADPEIVGS